MFGKQTYNIVCTMYDISRIGGIDCAPPTNTNVVDKTEILFQCIKGSGKFFAICTEEINSKQCSPLPVMGNISNSETGNLNI